MSKAAVLTLRAPAKLNLFLHVTGRRPDGYHDLETLFQLVDLCDDVRVAVREDGQILRDPSPTDPTLGSLPDEADLTVRAARLLQAQSGTRLGAGVHVTKRIPPGGGLGGGSSDAAAVLLALNDLWDLGWPRERLAGLGAQLGADVPVFIYGRNAFATGRGDVLEPVTLPARWFLVLHPGVSVATVAIFGDPQLTRDTPARRIPGVPPDGGHNDCEPVVRRRYPEVAAALDWLGARAVARLTGTGACVFAPFDTAAQAQAAAAELPPAWQAFVVRGVVDHWGVAKW
ncbi:MAG: 4-diphosphocytidyl-2-C-methyl-D-erythritol kinase [Pseudomonadota bacterium]